MHRSRPLVVFIACVLGIGIFASCEKVPPKAPPKQTAISSNLVTLRIFTQPLASATVTVYADGHFIKEIHPNDNGHPVMPVKYQAKLSSEAYDSLVAKANAAEISKEFQNCSKEATTLGKLEFLGAATFIANCAVRTTTNDDKVEELANLLLNLDTMTKLDEPLSLYASKAMAVVFKRGKDFPGIQPWPLAKPSKLEETLFTDNSHTGGLRPDTYCYTYTGFDFLVAWLNGLLTTQPEVGFYLPTGDVVTPKYVTLAPDETGCADLKSVAGF